MISKTISDFCIPIARLSIGLKPISFVFLHSAAYVLMNTFRTLGLRGTPWAKAQFDQMQIRI